MPEACGSCGYQVPAGARFCPTCGHPVGSGGPAPRRAEPRVARSARPAPPPDLEFASGADVYRPRPAAQVARRPLSFPSPLGAGMMIGGALLTFLGTLVMSVPASAVTVFGFGSGRTLPLLAGTVVLVVAVAARSSPSPTLRSLLGLAALAVATLVIVDSRRLGGAPRGAGMGIALVGAIVVVGGTFLREER